MALFTGAQYLCTFNIVAPPLFISFSKCLEGVVHNQRVHFVGVPYWPSYGTDKFISCVVPGSSQWFFHFGEEIAIAWTHIGWVRWMFQNFPLPAAQEVRDNSNGVTHCIFMKNDGVLLHQVSSFLMSAGRRWCCRNVQCYTSCQFNFDPGTLL